MGSYGVDSVLFDEELKSIPKALMLAANDPVGAWGAVKWLEEREWVPTLITGPATDNESGSRAIRELTNVPAVNARSHAEELTDTVLHAFRNVL